MDGLEPRESSQSVISFTRARTRRSNRFRRINGYRDMWILKRAHERHTREVTSSRTAA